MKEKNLKKYFLTGVILIVILGAFFVFQRTYTITYDTKGGTLYRSIEVKPKTVLEKPADPVLEGYIFEGWYVGDEEYDFSKPVESDLVITAKWKSVTK